MTRNDDAIHVRRATPGDAATVHRLSKAFFAEIDMAYRMPIERLSALLSGDPPRLSAWIAERNARVLGFALSESLIDTNHGTEVRVLHDFFVAAEHRNQGVGSLLFAAVRDEAERGGASGMSWIAERNGARDRFYARHGAEVDPGDGFFTLSFSRGGEFT